MTLSIQVRGSRLILKGRKMCGLIGLGLGLFSVVAHANPGLDYPELYRELGLPEFQPATVVQLGRVNDSLEGGLSIWLETPATHGELRGFYEAQFDALAWTLNETIAVQKMRAAGLLEGIPFSAVFCGQDGTGFSVYATDMGATRQVKISVIGESPSCTLP